LQVGVGIVAAFEDKGGNVRIDEEKTHGRLSRLLLGAAVAGR
jgi:hypothetical protein